MCSLLLTLFAFSSLRQETQSLQEDAESLCKKKPNLQEEAESTRRGVRGCSRKAIFRVLEPVGTDLREERLPGNFSRDKTD